MSFLDENDVLEIQESVKNIKGYKTSWLKSMFICKLFCKKDKQLKLVSRAEKLYTKSLDIRSIVKDKISLTLALDLFMTKEQVSLYKYYRA